MKANNLVGKRFGKLTVVARAENSSSGKTKWICLCDCGNTKRKSVASHDLISGKVKSCGCLYKEANKWRNAKHSMTKSRLYGIWVGIKQRCRKNKSYAAKNITICQEWNNFNIFHEWAMSHGYSDDLTIDRIDNDKGYSPDNCQWVTMKDQQNNRTNNRIISYNGVDFTAARLANFLGISPPTLLWRINHGWDQKDWGMKPNLSNKSIRRKEQ